MPTRPRKIRRAAGHRSWSRHNEKLHAHSFMVLTADDRAQNLILTRFRRRSQCKLVRTRFEFKVPARNFGVIFCAKQRESMDGPIAVPSLSLARFNAQE